VVVLAHGGLRQRDYAGSAEEALVAALAAQGGHVVVAGDSTSANQDGLIAEVRASKSDRAAVSTVDNANSPFGQVSTVLALASANQGQVGHYGTDQSADALFPAPAK
jgi:ABC-type branched-subunit amino acid transport system substrate-binding protein